MAVIVLLFFAMAAAGVGAQEIQMDIQIDQDHRDIANSPDRIEVDKQAVMTTSSYGSTPAPTTATTTTMTTTRTTMPPTTTPTTTRTTMTPTTTTYAAPPTTRAPTLAPAPPTTPGYTSAPAPATKPNIFYFVADDLGRSDVSFTQGNLQTPTPNIDKLAWDGIILNRHYSNPICTPTRAAFLTSKYTFHTGMQTSAISEGEPWGLPTNFKIQPTWFKSLGYTSYHIGKWHLGNFDRAHYPVNRGFDDSFGITAGDCNWFNYTSGWITPVPNEGRNFRINGKEVPWNDTNNWYAPDMWTSRAEQIIRNSDPSKPWVIHFWTTVVHTAGENYGAVLHTMPQFQLRPSVYSFSDQFVERRKELAIVQAMDDSFRRVIEALTNKGVINNTILVFFADNGAPIPPDAAFVHGSNYGSNYPLRLGKGGLFEGGVRTASFIWSPLLKKRGRISNQLFHVTDWFPTMYEAAGGNVANLAADSLDGMSQWKSLTGGLNYGPRMELVNNIDTAGNQYAMIYQDSYGGLYKLIGGNVFNNNFTGWFVTPGTSDSNLMRVWTPVTVNCNFPEGMEVSLCQPWKADCLFDLVNDPCESNNIAGSYPSMLKLLQDKIHAYNTTSIKNVNQPFDYASLPTKWNNWWVPWLDPVEILDKVPLPYQPFSLSSSF